MKFRAMQAEDLDIVMQIEQNSFATPWTKQMFSAMFVLPYQYAYVLEEEGQVCGYCCLSVLFEDAELLNIAVNESCRNRGVGTYMLAEALQRAKAMGAEKCFLEVRRNNHSAIGLYEKFGFEQYGEIPKYYGDEDALLMRNEL